MDDEKLFVCSFKNCSKHYSTKYSLQRHFTIRHKKSKRFTCKICKKILSSNQNLKEHSYTHSEEKPLLCPFPGCLKLFRQSSQLSAHKKFHLYATKALSSELPLGIEKTSEMKIFQLTRIDEEAKWENSAEGIFEIPKIFEPELLRLSLARFI